MANMCLSEGARGSLAKEMIAKYDLDADCDVPKFGIGMKEIWEVKPENHNEGEVTHTMGWPLGWKNSGGSFVYHLDNNQVYVGYIVDLNYKNPHLYPYMEFQRFKHHPKIAKLLEGGKRVAYGARVVTKGGFQSMPQAAFPGGALLGCSVGLVNLPRIKGNHNAMHSGIEAAEAAFARSKRGVRAMYWMTMTPHCATVRDWQRFENCAQRGAFERPVWPLGRLDHRRIRHVVPKHFQIFAFGHAKARQKRCAGDEPADKHSPIDYPKPDGKLSFDRLTNVSFSMTNHEESQPAHLRLSDPNVPVAVNLPNMQSLRNAIALQVSMKSSKKRAKIPVLSSISKTVCIVKPVISRIQARISHGSHPKVAMGRTIQICKIWVPAAGQPVWQTTNKKFQ
jgi:electron-transferring-flavoprotein dehydrogenase